jgi:hypothetical protein
VREEGRTQAHDAGLALRRLPPLPRHEAAGGPRATEGGRPCSVQVGGRRRGVDAQAERRDVRQVRRRDHASEGKTVKPFDRIVSTPLEEQVGKPCSCVPCERDGQHAPACSVHDEDGDVKCDCWRSAG